MTEKDTKPARPTAKTSAKPATKTTAKPATETAAKTVQVLEVVGPATGFRRAGFRFGAEPVQFADGDLTDAQIRAIKGEPKLTTVIRDVPAT